MPVVPKLSDSLIVAQPVNQPETVFVADATALQLVNEPEDDVIDIQLAPVSRRRPSIT